MPRTQDSESSLELPRKAGTALEIAELTGPLHAVEPNLMPAGLAVHGLHGPSGSHSSQYP